MTLSVRSGTPLDAKAVVDFNLRLAAESEDLHLPRAVVERGVERALSDASLARYFIAEVSTSHGVSIVGQTMVTYEWSDWRDGLIWWIQSVYVTPEARERGVFKALHERVRGEARMAGAVGLRLYVLDSNARAREVYRRRGMDDSHYRVLEEMFAPPGP
jgi:GNAT superfamily N-acetyltransferase